MLFASHDRRFRSALSNRVLEVSDGGPRIHGGGYKQYVAESGQKRPV
jgi:ATPase subunit of ABC transporter with duplicated ATPase domains